jgi:hypothetical protein
MIGTSTICFYPDYNHNQLIPEQEMYWSGRNTDQIRRLLSRSGCRSTNRGQVFVYNKPVFMAIRFNSCTNSSFHWILHYFRKNGYLSVLTTEGWWQLNWEGWARGNGWSGVGGMVSNTSIHHIRPPYAFDVSCNM